MRASSVQIRHCPPTVTDRAYPMILASETGRALKCRLRKFWPILADESFPFPNRRSASSFLPSW